MMASSTSPTHVIYGTLLPSRHHLPSSNSYSSALIKWSSNRDHESRPISWRAKNQAIRVLANPNASPEKGKPKKEIIMVDPLEAKQLAKKQMEAIKAKERLQRRRRIEAINGAWAMIGLTAGLVVEGHTGKNILSQLTGYWEAFVGIFSR